MPDVAVVVTALVFAAVVIIGAVGIDRWAAVKKSNNDLEQQRDMSQKLVDAMRVMSGQGLAGDVMRTMSNVIDVEPQGKNNNGHVAYQPTQHRAPDGWPQRASAESR